MERVVRSVLEALDRLVDVVGAGVRGGAEAFDPLQPGTWTAGFWALVGAFVALVVLALLRRRSRRPMGTRAPELLVTRGEVVPDPMVRRSGAGTVTMTVSNLSRYPVQVLEVAVRTGRGRSFGVAEVGALVPAMGEVDVESRIPVGRLEDGVLDVYAYAAATKVKTFRHRAELVWEPWAKRFKVAPLEQRITPTRSLASARQDVVRLAEEPDVPYGGWALAPEPSAPRMWSSVASADRVGADATGDDSDPRRAPDRVPADDDGLAVRRSDGAPRGGAAPGGEALEPGPAQLFAMLDERPPLAGTHRATSAQVLALNELLVTDADVGGELEGDDDPPAGGARVEAESGARQVATGGAATDAARASEAPSAPYVPLVARSVPPKPRSGAEARASRAARPRGTVDAGTVPGAPAARSPGAEAPGAQAPGAQVPEAPAEPDPRPEPAARGGPAAARSAPSAPARSERDPAPMRTGTPQPASSAPARDRRSESDEQDDGKPRRRGDTGPLEFPDEF